MWYLRLNVKIFVLWPSGVFVLVHLHFSSHTHSLTAAEPLFLRASISTGNVRNKQIFAQSFEPERRTEKRKTETNVYEIYCREETPLPSGGSSLSSDLLKAAVFECLRIHLIHFFLQWSDCVPGKKKPLYVHMTKQYSIADHIWPWNLPALQSCIHVSALRLQHVHLAFIYLSGLKSALSAPYTSQIEVSKIHRIWGAGRKKGNCK